MFESGQKSDPTTQIFGMLLNAQEAVQCADMYCVLQHGSHLTSSAGMSTKIPFTGSHQSDA